MKDLDLEQVGSDEDLLLRAPFDLSVAQQYSKRRCNKCYGRGYLSMVHSVGEGPIRKGSPVKEEKIYCNCVYKNFGKADK